MDFATRLGRPMQCVFVLSHRATNFYCGDWIRKDKFAICSSNDGLRPVIIKIEASDVDSEINYKPIE